MELCHGAGRTLAMAKEVSRQVITYLTPNSYDQDSECAAFDSICQLQSLIAQTLYSPEI